MLIYRPYRSLQIAGHDLPRKSTKLRHSTQYGSNIRMSSYHSHSGSSGIAFIICGVIVVSLLDTLMTGSYLHWIPAIAAIIVGLWAIAAIGGH